MSADFVNNTYRLIKWVRTLRTRASICDGILVTYSTDQSMLYTHTHKYNSPKRRQDKYENIALLLMQHTGVPELREQRGQRGQQG